MKNSPDFPQEKIADNIFLRGSATVGHTLLSDIFDHDGLIGGIINYQWQQLVNDIWIDIFGETARSLTLTDFLLGMKVRVIAICTDSLGHQKSIATSGVIIAAQNVIVIENRKPGTTAWQIHENQQATTEIMGYANATSINKGQDLNFKVALAQAGQYKIDVYRLGYYSGTGGRLVVSITGLDGVTPIDPVIDLSTRLVEYKWKTSYTLHTDSDWVSGIYFAKLTDSRTGKQNYIHFVLRDDHRPADIGFQDAIATHQAYNNYGGYSAYNFNSTGGVPTAMVMNINVFNQSHNWPAFFKTCITYIQTKLRRSQAHGQRANQVSFDRPCQYDGSSASEQYNNPLTWEHHMIRWLESQGYDVSYYTNIDVSTNPFQLYSQQIFLSVGHDEYWSMEQRNNVEQARDRGINLAFFSANTAYWRVRFDPSSRGQPNRIMSIYKDTTGIGTGESLDPIAKIDPAAATTLFRSPQVNRPENALLGVGYIGDIGCGGVYQGFDYVVSNASDPYYDNTGLQNGDRLRGLVGYEYDAVLNNDFTPAGLVVLSQSPVPSSGLGQLGLLPSGTNDTISNAVRYTASSGAKVFSTGSIQWIWGLNSDLVTNSRVDSRAQQIAVNVFADMGAIPTTPDSHLIDPLTDNPFSLNYSSSPSVKSDSILATEDFSGKKVRSTNHTLMPRKYYAENT